MERIPVAGPWITAKEIDYVTDAVTNAWYGNANIYHGRFEKAFAEYVGTRYAIALPSCTSAIHLSLLALGVGPDDEVVVPDLTWIASAAPISYVGAKPVFADVDEKRWTLDPGSFAACITPATKAVIVVDLYGSMPEMDAIRSVAQQHGIAVIEDAAEAVGSVYHGQQAGSFGETGVFSFHGSKTLTTGEGGMLVTNSEDIYRRVLFLRDHGRRPGDVMFFNAEVAYKYKMSSMQAALGLAQVERLEELVAKKRQIFAWYEQALADTDGLTLNYEPPDTRNSYWMVTAVLDPSHRLGKEELIRSMSERGVDCRPLFHPLSFIPAFRDLPEAERARKRNQVSYRISPFGINLPSSLILTEEQVVYVCDSLKQVLGVRASKSSFAALNTSGT
jgi:perosamine synthetase